jgi:hypothetical protein
MWKDISMNNYIYFPNSSNTAIHSFIMGSFHSGGYDLGSVTYQGGLAEVVGAIVNLDSNNYFNSVTTLAFTNVTI